MKLHLLSVANRVIAIGNDCDGYYQNITNLSVEVEVYREIDP